MDIKPIRNDEDHGKALKRIESLWNSEPGTPEYDQLEILATLVEDYEEKNHQIEPPDPIEAIKFRMEQQGLTRKDLEAFIGSRGRVSEVLNGKRTLSLRMIRQLHEHLGIPAEILILTTGDRKPKRTSDR